MITKKHPQKNEIQNKMHRKLIRSDDNNNDNTRSTSTLINSHTALTNQH